LPFRSLDGEWQVPLHVERSIAKYIHAADRALAEPQMEAPDLHGL
jgi:hypothetical protein